MTLTLAIGNQKGGVGKTSLVAGLAAALIDTGKRTLVVDADPQANVTTIMGVYEPEFTLNDVLASVRTPDDTGVAAGAIVPAGEGWGGAWVLPSERRLAERENDAEIGQETRLRTALTGAKEDYDVVLIDSPPSLGRLTANALVAADEVLIVTQARGSSVDGVYEFIRTLKNVRSFFTPSLTLSGIVVNQFRSDRSDPAYWLDVIVQQYGEVVFQPRGLIPEREVIAQAAAAHLPINSFGSRASDVWVPLKYIGERTVNRAQEAPVGGKGQGRVADG